MSSGAPADDLTTQTDSRKTSLQLPWGNYLNISTNISFVKFWGSSRRQNISGPFFLCYQMVPSSSATYSESVFIVLLSSLTPVLPPFFVGFSSLHFVFKSFLLSPLSTCLATSRPFYYLYLSITHLSPSLSPLRPLHYFSLSPLLTFASVLLRPRFLRSSPTTYIFLLFC